MSDRILDIATATRLVSERAHLVGIIECCSMAIRAKDDLLMELQSRLLHADSVVVDEKIDAQDTRLADAIVAMVGDPSFIATPTPAALNSQPSTIH